MEINYNQSKIETDSPIVSAVQIVQNSSQTLEILHDLSLLHMQSSQFVQFIHICRHTFLRCEIYNGGQINIIKLSPLDVAYLIGTEVIQS